MTNFPNSLSAEITPITWGIGPRGDAALTRIHDRGYRVANGLTSYFAGAISIMGYQNSIREYCPRDITDSRFKTLESTKKWLTKGGGRAVFLLLSGGIENGRLEGYGWTGHEPSEHLADYPITSAYRIGEQSQGKGLGADFVQVVVSATNSKFANGLGIGLETWESNRALNLYRKIGFEIIHKSLSLEFRPTINSEEEYTSVQDRRIYMGYPKELS